MTYMWLFCHTAITVVGHDYGDFMLDGFPRVSSHGKGCALQWELALDPSPVLELLDE